MILAISAASLYSSPLFSFVFPFLLVFAVVYGLLEKSGIFGDKHDVNAIIALAIGILFATSNAMLKLTFIVLPVIALILVIAFFSVVLFYAVGGENSSKAKKLLGIIVGIIALILVIVFVILPLFPNLGMYFSTSTIGSIMGYIIVLIFIIIVIWIMTKS